MGEPTSSSSLRITFFARTVIGYVAWPDAILVRGLASALANWGHHVRVVEERRNAAYVSTLQIAGSEPARLFYRNFSEIQHNTYEPRHGSHLLEWVARELALLDVAIAVEGIDDPLCRLLASIRRSGLTRAYLSFRAADFQGRKLGDPDLSLFDRILSPAEPPGGVAWAAVPPTISAADLELVTSSSTLVGIMGQLATPEGAAIAFERAVETLDAV